jgi:hypothetical protein
MLNGAGDLSVHNGLLDVQNLVVLGESASALGERRVLWKLSDSCHQHALHQVDTMFEDDVT